MQRLRIGFGLSLGLLLGASLMHCSFYLPERTVCTGTADGSCKPSDLGPLPPDLAKDPNDPSVVGPYAVATLPMPTLPPGLIDQVLLGPSDDGAGISPKESTYPLVLIAPPSGLPPTAMRQYADRLTTHGFIVGIYQVTDQANHTGYRDTALGYLNFILNNTDASIKTRVDAGHVGLMGYQLGAKISIAMAAQNTSIGALFLIDPVDVLTASGPLDGAATIAQLSLAAGGTIALVGEPISTAGAQPCVQSPQKGYPDFYAAAKAPALGISFGNANLGDFMEGYPDPYCTAGSTAPRSQTQGLTAKFATAYFQWLLKGQARQREYLLGADFQSDAQTANLTRTSK